MSINSPLLTKIPSAARVRSLVYCGVATGISALGAIAFLVGAFWYSITAVIGYAKYTSPAFILICYCDFAMLSGLGLSIAAKVINRKMSWATANIIYISILTVIFGLTTWGMANI